MNEIQDVPNQPAEPEISPIFMRLSRQPDSPVSGVVVPGIVEKRWGLEKIYANSEYCLKALEIREGESTSMHFHKDKTETLLVVSGRLKVQYKTREGEETEVDLEPGEALTICPGFMHKLVGISNVVIVEGSTRDHPWDSFRVNR